MADSIVSRTTDQHLSNQGLVYEDGVRSIFNQVMFIKEKKFHMGKNRNAKWTLYNLIDLETWEERKKEKEEGKLSLEWPKSSVPHKEGTSEYELECKNFKIFVVKLFDTKFLVHFEEKPKSYRECPKV